MNTQKVKQAHEMTNDELFEELRERGFFLVPHINIDTFNVNCIMVSKEIPNKDIRTTYRPEWAERYKMGKTLDDYISELR